MPLPFDAFFTKSQLERWLNAMPRRFSCREFATPADTGQLSALSYVAERACVKGIRIALMTKGAEDLIIPVPLFPRFSGAGQAAVILADRELENAALLGGVCGQAFQLELVHEGLQGCWVSGNFRRQQAARLCRENEKVLAVMPFGVPKDPEGARLTRRKILTAFSPEDPTQWPYWAYRAAEAMRSAPSAVNRQPWRVGFSGRTLSYKGSRLDSLDTGIGLMHLLCALHEHPHHWRLAGDGKTLLAQLKEQNEPV